MGLQPRVAHNVFDGMDVGLEVEGRTVWGESLLPETFHNKESGPVLHGSNVYAVYWDPDDYYHGDWQNLIDGFLHDVNSESGSLSNVFAVDSQYTDKSNVPALNSVRFLGAYVDDDPYPSDDPPTAGCTDPRPLEDRPADKIKPITCVTDAQISEELEKYVTEQQLPKGMSTIYYILTPPGVAVCLDEGGPTGHCSDFEATEHEEETGKIKTTSYENSFCSYHGAINPDHAADGDENTILYGMIPWSAGGLGDGQLQEADENKAYWCQDGGFNPASTPSIERKEKEKEHTEKEETEYEEKTKEEKREIKIKRELEGPHQEEPNQGTCPSEDGYCDRGLADLIINQIAVEQQNIVTDPLLNAWQDEDGNEATDECRNFFAPTLGGSVTADEATGAGTLYNQLLNQHEYYLNDAFNLAALRLNFPGVPCVTGVNLVPRFTSPSPVNAGEAVGFDGMQSDITLNAGIDYSAEGLPQPTYATYTWNFGDGTPEVTGYAPGAPPCTNLWLSPCAASVFHSYQYGGTYDVTLTVRDVGGNTASVTHEVTVAGPPRTSSPGGSGSGGSGGTGSGSGSGASGGAHSGVPAPVAAALIVPQSLRSAVHEGLAVSYSVNEQVAGHFEVLLRRAVARRLGISGTPAVGLPAGSPPELVIAKAILVTTKGGHSTVHIQFSKRTAARLARAHKVSLMLRLVVRNAAASNPATTTVVSSVTLTR